MEIPLKAHVECTDGVYGLSAYVLIDPVMDKVTHLVVRADAAPNAEHVVPITQIVATIDNVIKLSCSQAELGAMRRFTQTEFVETKAPDINAGYSGLYGLGAYFYLPFVVSEVKTQAAMAHPQIPFGELAVQRGTRVEATDGYVGKVDEFVVNPADSRITYLVMREGHLWGKNRVIIPLSAMGEMRQDTLFLKIDKQQIGALPTFPIQERWL